jgi:hypothetical protein
LGRWRHRITSKKKASLNARPTHDLVSPKPIEMPSNPGSERSDEWRRSSLTPPRIGDGVNAND